MIFELQQVKTLAAASYCYKIKPSQDCNQHFSENCIKIGSAKHEIITHIITKHKYRKLQIKLRTYFF